MNIIIIGAGRIGTTLAQYLSEESHNVVVIDNNPEVVHRLQDSFDAQILQGDGSDLNLLNEAGLKKAELVLAITSSDEYNIVITLIASSHNPTAQVIARVRNSHYTTNQELLGGETFNRIALISPEHAASELLLHLVEVEQAFEVIPFLDGDIRIAGFNLDHDSPLVGLALKDIGTLPGSTKALVAAINRNNTVHVPKGNHVFQVGDQVYLTLVKGTSLSDTLRFLGKKALTKKKMVIIGAGSTGRRIAQELRTRGLPVTVVDKDLQACRDLAETMPMVTTLHGDATDADFMKTFIGTQTSLVALTGYQEVNFLIALLAHKLGAKQVITLMDNEAYISMAPGLGIDAVVSPKSAVVGSILRYIRQGKIIDAAPMLDGQLGAIFAEIQAGSALDGILLKDAPIPEGILIGAILRGTTFEVPGGYSQLSPGDNVLVIAHHKLLPKVDKLLSTGQE